MDFILDASIALAWCFEDEATPQTTLLLEELEFKTALVPSIWPLEISNILLSAQRKKRISFADMMQLLEMIASLNIQLETETIEKHFHETLSLAYNENLTTYDASYLELAIRLGLPVATKDKQLRQACINLGVKLIEV